MAVECVRISGYVFEAQQHFTHLSGLYIHVLTSFSLLVFHHSAYLNEVRLASY